MTDVAPPPPAPHGGNGDHWGGESLYIATCDVEFTNCNTMNGNKKIEKCLDRRSKKFLINSLGIAWKSAFSLCRYNSIA